MRVAWRTVGGIFAARRGRGPGTSVDLLDGLRRIGIDEISLPQGPALPDRRRRPRHAAGWCGPRPGRDRTTVETFFDVLGEERCAQIELVSCDMARWITGAGRRAAARTRCGAWTRSMSCKLGDRRARRGPPRGLERGPPEPGQTASSRRELKGARFALWKNPENLTDRQQTQARRRSSRPTAGSTAPTCSRSNCARSTGSRPTHAIALLDALAGVGAALPPARRSSSSPTRSPTQRAGIDAAIRTRALQRPRRGDQHPDPPAHPPRLRLPQPRRADRARDAHPRRPLPAASTVNPGLTRPTETAGDPVLRVLSSDGWGRAAFEPGMMVSLLLYAYARGERSSRGDRAPLRGGRRLPGDRGSAGARSRDDRALSGPARGSRWRTCSPRCCRCARRRGWSRSG